MKMTENTSTKEITKSIAPPIRKKVFGGNPPKNFTATFCDLFRWGIFTHFHSARLKTHYILPQLPPKGRKGVGESGEDVTSLI